MNLKSTSYKSVDGDFEYYTVVYDTDTMVRKSFEYKFVVFGLIEKMHNILPNKVMYYFSTFMTLSNPANNFVRCVHIKHEDTVTEIN